MRAYLRYFVRPGVRRCAAGAWFLSVKRSF